MLLYSYDPDLMRISLTGTNGLDIEITPPWPASVSPEAARLAMVQYPLLVGIDPPV